MSRNEEIAGCLRDAWQLLYDTETPSDAACVAANGLCNRALALAPSHVEGWVLKTQIELYLGDPAAALAAAGMALRADPQHAELHYLRAVALSHMGQWLLALRAVMRAFRCCKRNSCEALLEGLYYQKAVVLEALARSDEALAALEAGLSSFPDSDLLKAGLAPLQRQRMRRKLVVLEGGRS